MPADVFGPYRIEGLLGQGGMGAVYRAHDTEHDRTVALKVLPDYVSNDEQFRLRFQREARIAARVNSPHVIPIHRYGEIDGRLFLDMALIDGVDLARILDTSGPLPPCRAVDIIEQVATALDAAHRADLVHRDVKPSNILVCNRLRPSDRDFVYLADFGIARPISISTSAALTSAGDTVGTWAYMAPEATGSPLPCQRPRRVHATYTPGTARATRRSLPS